MIVLFLCIALPFLILFLTYRSTLLRKVGSIILAYVFGCALGLTGIIPGDEATHAMQGTVCAVAVPMAIPLMLFSTDLRSWMRLAPVFIKSTLAALLGCALAVAAGFFLFGGDDAETFASVGGMLSGLYTGGNANLASLKMALGVDDATFLLVSACSTLSSAVYLFFVIIAGKRTLRLVLPDWKKPIGEGFGALPEGHIESHEDELFLGLFCRDNLPHLLKALLLAALIVVLAAGVALLFPASAFQSVFILAVSLFSVVASLFGRVRAIKRSFELGTLFILVFSVAVASQVSLDALMGVDRNVFLFTAFVTAGTLFFHVVLSALLRIDTDTTLTTSISLICSPPFAPVMGSALRNKAVIAPGIAVGLFGYAVGTYFGFVLAKGLLLLF